MTEPIEEMLQRALERNEVYANPDVPALVKALKFTIAKITDIEKQAVADILINERSK